MDLGLDIWEGLNLTHTAVSGRDALGTPRQVLTGNGNHLGCPSSCLSVFSCLPYWLISQGISWQMEDVISRATEWIIERMDWKLRGNSLVTSTLDPIEWPTWAQDHTCGCWKWWWTSHHALEMPFAPPPGLSTPTRSEVQTHTSRLCIFCARASAGFYGHIIFIYSSDIIWDEWYCQNLTNETSDRGKEMLSRTLPPRLTSGVFFAHTHSISSGRVSWTKKWVVPATHLQAPPRSHPGWWGGSCPVTEPQHSFGTSRLGPAPEP